MFNLILKELWTDVKRQKEAILHSFLIWLLFDFTISVTLLTLNSASAPSNIRQPLQIAETFLLLLLFVFIFKDLPLRISRGIYVCPAGNKEKRRYLLLQLAVKLVLCLLLPALILFLEFRQIFLSDDPVLQIVQLLLWIFTSYNINLRIGVGAKSGREVDEQGYRVISRAEESITVYWTCFLIIEWVAFLVFLLVDTGLKTGTVLIIWSAFMLLNLFFAIRYTKPLLQDMSFYEKIYCQKQPDIPVQYDI